MNDVLDFVEAITIAVAVPVVFVSCLGLGILLATAISVALN